MTTGHTNPYDAPIVRERGFAADGTTSRFSRTNALIGTTVGIAISLVALELAAGVVGGVLRLAPCHSAPDFISGAVFGLMFGVVFLTFPPVLIGAIIIVSSGAALGAWTFGYRKVSARDHL